MANIKRKSPITPQQIIAARGHLFQVDAAAIAGYSVRQWINFEMGKVAMPEAIFNEFVRKRNTCN